MKNKEVIDSIFPGVDRVFLGYEISLDENYTAEYTLDNKTHTEYCVDIHKPSTRYPGYTLEISLFSDGSGVGFAAALLDKEGEERYNLTLSGDQGQEQSLEDFYEEVKRSSICVFG